MYTFVIIVFQDRDLERSMKLKTLVQNVAKLTDAGEINEIVMAIKVARDRNNRQRAGNFFVGMNVMVVQKTKSTPATIVKMNTKKVVVEMNWQGRGMTKVNVPYSMLKAA